MGRKFMFYWCILQKSDSELVFQAFQAMKSFPVDHDWYACLLKDLHEYNINLTEEDIKALSKYAFKKVVREKIWTKCQQELRSLQDVHSKTKNLRLSDKPQAYLTSKRLNTHEKQLLFKL